MEENVQSIVDIMMTGTMPSRDWVLSLLEIDQKDVQETSQMGMLKIIIDNFILSIL